MKYVRVGFPILVVVLTVVNFVFAMYESNSSAMWANVTAFFGWLIIAADEYRSEKVLESINQDAA